MDKISLADIKKKNFADVYHFIYHNPRCSKQSIASQLNMSLPTVTQHLLSLTQEGLIKKSGQLSSPIGRKATAYAIVPDARFAIGVEIVYDHITLSAVNLLGEIMDCSLFSISFSETEAYYKTVCQKIRDFLEKQTADRQKLLGIGFGLQGLVSSDGKEVIYGRILNCTGLRTEVFSPHLPVPCLFFHDAQCAALVDLWHNPLIQNAVYLSLGHHLGGAVILNGKIQKGRTGKSGTFEHMTLIPNGKHCYCGKKGCVECYCSAQGLLHPKETLADFFRKKDAGDKECLIRWNTYLEHLGSAINNIHMVLDIDVILGGHMSPYLTEADLKQLHHCVQEKTAFPEDTAFICAGTREKNAISAGAALPFIKEYLNDINEAASTEKKR